MSFMISPSALTQVTSMIAAADVSDPVILIGKSQSPIGGGSTWYIGLAERLSLSGLPLDVVDGLTVFADRQFREELHRSMLDLQGGRLVVVPSSHPDDQTRSV